jgi:hypothetical protein
LANIINAINAEYTGLKEALYHILFPMFQRKIAKILGQFTKKFNEILQPMMDLAYSPVASPSEAQKSEITKLICTGSNKSVITEILQNV